MRNILLTISYDGTDFCGWQRQDLPDKPAESVSSTKMRTVQGELEKALAKLHGQSITLYGSGRTDSGVHAAGQAANFFSPVDSIPVTNYPRAINSYLPKDVRVLDAAEVDEKFNARYSATSRVYRYFICMDENIHAVQTKYVWHLRNKKSGDINISKLNAMAELLRGEMDCASFAASGDSSISTNRYIEKISFFEQDTFPSGKLLVFEIEANAFLYRMVRTLCGTFMSLAQTAGSAEEARAAFQKIIDARDRRAALVTAPSEGLFLWQIKFDGIRRHV